MTAGSASRGMARSIMPFPLSTVGANGRRRSPMRVFVSSSFEDLREHRAAAIRVLRQLGHDVVAMEDMTAGSATPLIKVLEMVDRSEAYVGIFAWRYGYVPKAKERAARGRRTRPQAQAVAVADAIPGETS